MIRPKSRFLFAGILLVAGIAACEGIDASNSPTGPSAPQPVLGSVLGIVGGILQPPVVGEYRLANDPLIPQLIGTVLNLTRTLGLTGGTLELLGHKIVVPSGAVTQNTSFTISVLPTGYAQVELDATRKGLLGVLLNVGEQGFNKPVATTLYYGRSTNITDPSKLVVLRLNGPNGQPEALPTRIDPVRRTVTADLDHFSRYAIAFPN